MMRTKKGTIGVELLLIAGAALAIGVFAGGWKPLQMFKPKPPTEQLTKLQGELDAAQAALKAAAQAQAAAAAAERAKQVEQVRHAQQMQSGAIESLARQPAEHRTVQTALASDLLRRSEFALGLAIGGLPAGQQAEILKIVDQALSGVEAERAAAQAALKAKDEALAMVSRERDEIRAELPKLAAKVAAAESKAEAKAAHVEEVTGKLKTWAELKDAAERKAGSFAAQIDRLWRTLFWVGGVWLFLVYILPGLVKYLNSGPLKNILRDASGYATAPLLYHDAKKKLSATKPDETSP